MAGDITGSGDSGDVGVEDALLCLRIIMGFPVTVDGVTYESPYPGWLMSRANVTGGETVDVSDLVLILRRVVGGAGY